MYRQAMGKAAPAIAAAAIGGAAPAIGGAAIAGRPAEAAIGVREINGQVGDTVARTIAGLLSTVARALAGHTTCGDRCAFRSLA